MQHKRLRNCMQNHGYLLHILDLISPNILQSLHVKTNRFKTGIAGSVDADMLTH